MGEPFPALVQAVQAYKGDKYSQARRWSKGYSDCSSFVGKGMRKLGHDMGASTTFTYLGSSKWITVPSSQAGAGDIAVNAAHMVLVTGPGTAIGQQNPRRNVQTGSISELMHGTGGYKIKRYKGGANITFAGYTEQAGFSLPSSLIKTTDWLGNSTNWLRVGMVVAGALLLWIAIVGIGKSNLGDVLGAATAQGKKVMKNGRRKGGNR